MAEEGVPFDEWVIQELRRRVDERIEEVIKEEIDKFIGIPKGIENVFDRTDETSEEGPPATFDREDSARRRGVW
jgi:5'-deoxynucleotidase YfbR-like HD superfamily hydrolase